MHAIARRSLLVIAASLLASAGLWNVRALYILPAPSGSGADWDVHWATFVWGIGGPDN